MSSAVGRNEPANSSQRYLPCTYPESFQCAWNVPSLLQKAPAPKSLTDSVIRRGTRSDGHSDVSWGHTPPGVDQASSTKSSCPSPSTNLTEDHDFEQQMFHFTRGPGPCLLHSDDEPLMADMAGMEAFSRNNEHQELRFSSSQDISEFQNRYNSFQRTHEESADVESCSSDEGSASEIGSDDGDDAEEMWPFRCSLNESGQLTVQLNEKLLMRKTLDDMHLFPTSPSVTSCTGTDNSRTSNGSGGIMRLSQGGRASKSRPSLNDNGNDEGDPDRGKDDKDGQKPVGDTRELAPVANAPKFACPFFKKDPSKYQNFRGCPGPGWPTVHRLKSHLYIHHTRPIQCSRCWETFASMGRLEQHLRAEPPSCHVRPENRADGIDEQQKAAIRTKKRSRNAVTEADKWRHLYRIIFPGDVEIPWPYYTASDATRFTPDSDELANFEAFRRSEMERRLTARLQDQILPQNDGLNHLRENLQRQVMDIYQEVQEEVMHDFQRSRSSGSRASAQDPAHAGGFHHDGHARPSISDDRQHYSLENRLDALYTVPPPPAEFILEHDESSQPFGSRLMEDQPAVPGSSQDSGSGRRTGSSSAARAHTSSSMTDYSAFPSRNQVSANFQATPTVEQRQWAVSPTFIQNTHMSEFSFGNNQIDAQRPHSEYQMMPQLDMLLTNAYQSTPDIGLSSRPSPYTTDESLERTDLFQSSLGEGQTFQPLVDSAEQTIDPMWNTDFTTGSSTGHFLDTENEARILRPRKRRH